MRIVLVLCLVLLYSPVSASMGGKVTEKSGEKAEVVGGHFHLVIDNGLISLESKEADLRKIFRILSKKMGIEIVISPNLQRKISTNFQNLSLDAAVKRLVDNWGIVFSRKGSEGDLRIVKILVLAKSKVQTKNRIEEHQNKPVSGYPLSPYARYPSKRDSDQEIPNRGPPLKKLDMPRHKRHMVPNECVVRFKANLSKEEIVSLVARENATIKKYIAALNYYVISLPSGLTPNEALNLFREKNVIEQGEPNYLIPLQNVPNDPEFSRQWNLLNIGQGGGSPGADIDAREAWNFETGNSGVIIAIVDTGIDYTHPDLGPNIWRNPGEIPDNGIDDDGNGYIDDTMGWDFVDATGGAEDEDFVIPDNDPMDRDGHGTHVAGIAGAVGNNGIGIAGVAWNCQIMPVRAGYRASSGQGFIESDAAAQAIIYAEGNGARIINLSWGDYQRSSLIEDAISFAADRGALICAAAGNENSSEKIYPAGYSNDFIISVGATDNEDQKASFSNYGNWIDVSAPGVDIYSAYPDESYMSMSGTSMATPHVSGLAALLFSYFPEISPLEVKARIMRSADILANLSGDNNTSGRINAFSALTAEYSTPHIFTVEPNAAHVGDRIVIFGDHFGDSQGGSVVRFSPGREAQVISWKDSLIVCKVPEGVQAGEVTVLTSAGMSNEVGFDILVKYYEEAIIGHDFGSGGTPQGWEGDDQSWQYHLPFSFPFFGKRYDAVYICSNGYLDFTNMSSSYQNSVEALKKRAMIAPLWDDLVLNSKAMEGGEGVYIDKSSDDCVSIRWVAERYQSADLVNVQVILFKDGRIQFNYGPGNSNLSPTIGISGGNDDQYHLSSYNGAEVLDSVDSDLFISCEKSFTIPLSMGWNLISLPIEPVMNHVGQVMNNVHEAIGSVWTYEEGAWHVYSPENPDLSDLSLMKSGYGYWVKTTQNGAALQIHGYTAPFSRHLAIGWNLIGFNFLESVPMEEALAEIEEKVRSVWSYKEGAWHVYDPENSRLSDLDTVEPGMGYWIKLDE